VVVAVAGEAVMVAAVAEVVVVMAVVAAEVVDRAAVVAGEAVVVADVAAATAAAIVSRDLRLTIRFGNPGQLLQD
jgi:hypothetical protein